MKKSISPLHYAILSQDIELVRLLLENGAEINAQDMVGDTAVDWAYGQKDMVFFLKERGGLAHHEIYLKNLKLKKVEKGAGELKIKQKIPRENPTPLLGSVEEIITIGPSVEFKSGSYQLNHLIVDFPAEHKILSTKLSNAVNSNFEWWTEYISKHGNKSELPYHKNFGLSEAEYKKYLISGKEKKLILSPQKTDILVKNVDENILISNLLNEDLRVDKNSYLVYKKFKIAPEYIDIKDPNSIVGAWNGIEWKIDDGNSTYRDIFIFKLTLIFPSRGEFSSYVLFDLLVGETKNFKPRYKDHAFLALKNKD